MCAFWTGWFAVSVRYVVVVVVVEVAAPEQVEVIQTDRSE